MAAVLEDGLVMYSNILQLPLINSIKFLNSRSRKGRKGIFGIDQFSAYNTDNTEHHQQINEGLTIFCSYTLKYFYYIYNSN
jgi:hypothetical protein